ASSTASLTQTVAKATTMTLFGSAPGPAVSGQSLTFTATVSILSPGAGTPAGTIQFMIDGAAAGSPVSVSTAGGLPPRSLRTSLAPGAHTVTASYSGDGNFAPSLATVLTQMAIKASTTTVLGSSANPSVSGRTVNFTATISTVAPGGGTPSGTVQFVVDGSNA